MAGSISLKDIMYDSISMNDSGRDSIAIDEVGFDSSCAADFESPRFKG